MRLAGTDDFAAWLLAATLLLSGVVFLQGCSSEGLDDDAPSDAPPPASSETTAADVPAAPPTRTDQGRSVAERIADASLAARVKTALTEDRQLRTLDFEPGVTDGRVTLDGNVATREQGRHAADLAGEVDGVDDVLNRLTVDGEQIAWNAPEPPTDGAQTASESGGASSSGESAVADAGDDQQQAASQQQATSQDGTGSEAAEQYHVVEQGESLWAIASQNNISVARLRELNDLSSDNLMPGDRLRVE